MTDVPTERPSKVLTPAEAIRQWVPADCPSLVIGGMHLHNMPMALVRELVRQRAGRRIATLIAGPAAGLGADLLIGTGLVETAWVSYIGLEHFGLAPAFRRAVAEGRLPVHDFDAFSLLEAVRAGGAGLPFAAVPPGVARTDLPRTSGSLYREVVDPFTGDPAWVVPAIRPTVALIACQEADRYGNGFFRGATLADRTLALAADRVILQVERLVEPSVARRDPAGVGVPGFRVAAVVPVGFGCHPTSSHRYYNYDDVHIQTYQRLAATAAGFDDYVRRYCDEPATQDAYMDRVQDEEWQR
ncbi:MAG: CoA transferase subunit A [Chloroflexota bacterium]|nr:CoA transferase subunit A [Chloroflexota bacterium]